MIRSISRNPTALAIKLMLSFAEKYAKNINSQFGEDGIIAECLHRMNLEKGECVEIGGNDGLWLSNTANLVENGWSGKFVEADCSLYEKARDRWQHRPDVKCICSRVNGSNVNAFVTDSTDLLSSD